MKNINLKGILFGILLLASPICFSAQLVDSIPTSLTGNWSLCINFAKSKPLCQIKEKLDDSSDFSETVNRFVYQKEFIVSSELRQSTLAVWLGTIDDVDEVRINEQLVGKTGSLPPQFQSGFRYSRLYLIPSTLLKYNQFNQIEIRTFSSINKAGIGKHDIVIGEYFDFSHHQQEKDYLYIISMSILLLLMLFQMFYYFLVKGSDETIYLSIFLASFAVVAFTRSQAPLHLDLDLSASFKIEMFMISVGVVGFTFFIFRFFELEIRKVYIAGLFAIGLPGVTSMIYPDPLSVRYIAEIVYWLICLFAFLTAGSAVLISVAKRRKYSLIIGIFCVVGWLVMCFDAATQTNALFDLELPIVPFVLPITMVLLGIGMVLTITHKYWQVFKGATYDHLTGALLRPAFFQRLSEEIQRCQKDNSLLLIGVISIQEVKSINASYGHGVGNNLLVRVSEIITNYLKPFDLVCHFSGDEFCIAATVESRREAEKYLRNLHQNLVSTQQMVGTETELFIGAKLGGVIYNPDQHLSVSQLLQDANYGLAKAKSQKGKDYLLLNNPTVTA